MPIIYVWHRVFLIFGSRSLGETKINIKTLCLRIDRIYYIIILWPFPIQFIKTTCHSYIYKHIYVLYVVIKSRWDTVFLGLYKRYVIHACMIMQKLNIVFEREYVTSKSMFEFDRKYYIIYLYTVFYIFLRYLRSAYIYWGHDYSNIFGIQTIHHK